EIRQRVDRRMRDRGADWIRHAEGRGVDGTERRSDRVGEGARGEAGLLHEKRTEILEAGGAGNEGKEQCAQSDRPPPFAQNRHDAAHGMRTKALSPARAAGIATMRPISLWIG